MSESPSQVAAVTGASAGAVEDRFGAIDAWVNTPQFNWCRSKLPRHPQPVPPYQPEIAAEAVYWAAQHPRRELWVGYSTVQAIVGNKLSPWLADRYLARTAISGQQIDDMPVAPGRPDTLFEPLPEKAATHRELLAGVAGAAAAAGIALLRSR
jgi:hypothetical protein